MKVPISNVDCLNLDAPVLPAYEVNRDNIIGWAVCCQHCQTWHWHGPAEGHGETRRTDLTSLNGGRDTTWRTLGGNTPIEFSGTRGYRTAHSLRSRNEASPLLTEMYASSTLPRSAAAARSRVAGKLCGRADAGWWNLRICEQTVGPSD